jgi:hypothetical protein
MYQNREKIMLDISFKYPDFPKLVEIITNVSKV